MPKKGQKFSHYNMVNETHEQRAERFRGYRQLYYDKINETHRNRVKENPEEFSEQAKIMRKKGGDKARKAFVQQRKKIKQGCKENGVKVQDIKTLKGPEMEKTLEFLKRLSEERAKIKE